MEFPRTFHTTQFAPPASSCHFGTLLFTVVGEWFSSQSVRLVAVEKMVATFISKKNLSSGPAYSLTSRRSALPITKMTTIVLPNTLDAVDTSDTSDEVQPEVDEAVEEEEDLGDLGGESDDGDDSDEHRFIKKSWHYQDMRMTERHCEERVRFLLDFRKTMPKSKNPHKRLKLYQDRVHKVKARISVFRAKYAKKRADCAKARAARIASSKEKIKQTDLLGKQFNTAIRKDLAAKQAIATQAAISAIVQLVDASEDAKEEAAAAAYTAALEAAMANNPFKIPEKKLVVKRAKKVGAEVLD